MRDESRYVRQAALAEIGPDGQRRIRAATALIAGCGALGSMQAEWLARAGVGRLLLVDRDILEMHNLQRQLLYDEEDIRARLPKAIAAARRLKKINSEIEVEGRVEDLVPANAAEWVRRADVVLDGTDNLETRYLLNDAAVRERKPWIYGGVMGGAGMAMAVFPEKGPCLRCLYPEPPGAGDLPTCETMGVLNAAVAWVAALQVAQALKALVQGVPDRFHLHAMDVWSGKASAIRAERNPDCPCCGRRRFEFLESRRTSATATLCGRNAVQITPAIPIALDLGKLAERLCGLGEVERRGYFLEFWRAPCRLVVFPDGRVLVEGTMDKAEARTLVARYVGS